MDKATLVEIGEKEGEELVRTLDDSGLDVVAAFWFYVSDSDTWRLFIASPTVDQEGPKAVYERIQNVLSEKGHEFRISLRDISVISPDHSLVKVLNSVIRTGPTPTISSIRFTHNTVNNVFIEDAYIYRMN